jgi:hypothetical protein
MADLPWNIRKQAPNAGQPHAIRHRSGHRYEQHEVHAEIWRMHEGSGTRNEALPVCPISMWRT